MGIFVGQKGKSLGVRSDPGAHNGVTPERLSPHAKATGCKPMQVATQYQPG